MPPGISWRELALWLMGRRMRVRVEGPSMRPTLHEGQELLVATSSAARARVAIGDLVVVRLPAPSGAGVTAIKRVVAIDDRGWVRVAGDNALASTDSRQVGMLPPECVLGRVTCEFGSRRDEAL